MAPAFRHFLLLLLISSVFIIPAINTHETEHDETQQPMMEHRCIHDDLKYEPEFADIDEDTSAMTQAESLNEDERLLTATTYPKLRIVGYYAPLIADAPAAFASYIQNDLVPPIFSYFESALRVKYPVQGTLKLATSVKTVCGVATPAMLYNGVNADFVMMFDSNNNQASPFTASSRYCFLSSKTNRPIVAFTNFNRKFFTAANGNMVLHEQNMYTLMHEFTHAFGFSQSSFPYFIDSTGKTLTGHIKTAKIGGLTRTILDVAPLTSRLRTYYGCSTLQGAILENNGGSGTAVSHFERRFFTYELMSSGAIDGSRMSVFSLAALEGSGWYAPDYSFAEPFFFGQGMGCGFITGVCGTTNYNFPDEFCTGSARGCAPQGMSGGFCQSENTMLGCRWHKPDSYYNCENVNSKSNARLPGVEVYQRGGISKCFTGNLSTKSSASSTSFCFKYNCVGTGASTKLQVILGSVTATCVEKGKMSVKGYYGTIDCPDPLDFCGTIGKKYCPRGCMGRGTCTNNKCVCKAGFTGIDCAQKA